MTNARLDVDAALEALVHQLATLSRKECVIACGQTWRQLVTVLERLAEIRQRAVRQMREGMTLAEVARELDMSPTRVRQLLAAGRREDTSAHVTERERVRGRARTRF